MSRRIIPAPRRPRRRSADRAPERPEYHRAAAPQNRDRIQAGGSAYLLVAKAHVALAQQHQVPVVRHAERHRPRRALELQQRAPQLEGGGPGRRRYLPRREPAIEPGSQECVRTACGDLVVDPGRIAADIAAPQPVRRPLDPRAAPRFLRAARERLGRLPAARHRAVPERRAAESPADDPAEGACVEQALRRQHHLRVRADVGHG